MSSKRRRKKASDPADEKVAEVGGEEATGDESSSGEKSSGKKSSGKKTKPQSKSSQSAQPESAPSKKSLPAFGFAGDLLKKKGSEPADDPATASDDEGGDSSKASEVAETVAGALADEAASSEGEESDPHRIFSFADQLQSRQQQLDKDKGPEAKWETWVTFSLDDETFALPVEPVRQVVRVSNITRVPHAPRPIRGVTNLRGRVIPVIDLRMRVGLEPAEVGRQSRVVAVASRGRLLGLLVDAVHQVVHIDLNKVQPPPEDVMTIQSDYILGVYHHDESLILLLDVDRALVLREEAA